MMRRLLFVLVLMFSSALVLSAQIDRKEVRAGNRKFKKEDYSHAEIDYRKAVVKDTLSFAGQYNLASALYRQGDFETAGKSLESLAEVAADHAMASQYYYNKGDVALQKKDWQAAADAFREALLRDPSDIDAKENYIYAKLMMENDQNGGGGGGNDQNQDDQDNQDNDQNNDQNDQNQDQNQNDQDNQNDQNQNNQQPQSQPKISPQQAQQMLQAIQAKEKETQDKVNKEKAEALKSRQKEKNW